MKKTRILFEKERPSVHEKSCMLSIGNFDGFHRGHKKIIECLKKEAVKRNMLSAVVLFEKHTAEVINGIKGPYLTTPAEKRSFLEKSGTDIIIFMRFNRRTAEMPADIFYKKKLKKLFKIGGFVLGYDHAFGKGRNTPESFIKEEIIRVSPAIKNGSAISSTRIRREISSGRISSALSMLGHPYLLSGTVVRGKSIGKKLGFPTANIPVDPESKALPPPGVYAVTCLAEKMAERKAVLNIGNAETFGGSCENLAEVHIPGFSGDLYGKTLQILLRKKIRKEKRFSKMEPLIKQIEKDIKKADKLLT
ncbi:MAG: riboflavin biosynthesis protein RibF [Fibrobacterota bacterium]